MKFHSQILIIVASLCPLGVAAQQPFSAADASNQFAEACLQEIHKTKGNLAFSPFCVWSALTMCSAGASGEVLKEMQSVLHLDQKAEVSHASAAEWINSLRSSKQVEVGIGNRLWPASDLDLTPEFLQVTEKHYQAAPIPLDYQADSAGSRDAINRWVEAQTKEKIKDLLKPSDVPPVTRLILTSAIYLKADWEEEFRVTKPGLVDFVSSEGEVTKTLMMTSKRLTGYFANDRLQAVRLPYKGGEMSMLFVLPRTGVSVNSPDLRSKAMLEQVKASMEPAKVVMDLPRFTITQRFSLKDALGSLGMKKLFVEGLTEVSRKETPTVADVIHQTYIKVGEKGTEAAAAVAIISYPPGPAGKPEKLEFFQADHPFLFFLMDDRNDGILFAGRVENPDAATNVPGRGTRGQSAR